MTSSPSLAQIVAALSAAQDDATIHACPVSDDGLTPCCGRTPFELPSNDRMTADPLIVTCVRRIGETQGRGRRRQAVEMGEPVSCR